MSTQVFSFFIVLHARFGIACLPSADARIALRLRFRLYGFMRMHVYNNMYMHM